MKHCVPLYQMELDFLKMQILKIILRWPDSHSGSECDGHLAGSLRLCFIFNGLWQSIRVLHWCNPCVLCLLCVIMQYSINYVLVDFGRQNIIFRRFWWSEMMLKCALGAKHWNNCPPSWWKRLWCQTSQHPPQLVIHVEDMEIKKQKCFCI